MAEEPAVPERTPHNEGRHRGREAAVQMLYQWELGRAPVPQIAPAFWALREADPLSEEHQRFAESLVSGVIGSLERIDPLIAEAATHWRIERMNVLDRIVLRLAVYEFLAQPETPGKVVINEALELARTFSSDEAVRFVNGILDAIRRTLERA
jgi:N utilization substance protein B